jgi:hypothetical protein
MSGGQGHVLQARGHILAFVASCVFSGACTSPPDPEHRKVCVSQCAVLGCREQLLGRSSSAIAVIAPDQARANLEVLRRQLNSELPVEPLATGQIKCKAP